MRGLAKVEATLREAAFAYPEVKEEFPWGHRAMKVKGKAFVFMATEGDRLSLSVKLPASGVAALMFAFASPTGYGLGKSGWVTAVFAKGDDVPVPLLLGWMGESYRAIAPKRVAAALDGAAPPEGGKAKAKAKVEAKAKANTKAKTTGEAKAKAELKAKAKGEAKAKANRRTVR